MLKVWAWVWLGVMALLGWAPALMVSYGVAIGLALAFGWHGPIVLDVAYFGLMIVGLFMLDQVRNHFALSGAQRRWYNLAGYGGLALVWGAAYTGFQIWAGGY